MQNLNDNVFQNIDKRLMGVRKYSTPKQIENNKSKLREKTQKEGFSQDELDDIVNNLIE